MKEYLAVLLLILPGFACKCLVEWFKNGKTMEEIMDSAGKEDQWKFVIFSLLYSIWVLAVGYLIVNAVTPLPTMDWIRRRFDRPVFILGYSAAMMLACLLVAGAWHFIQLLMTSVSIRILRKQGVLRVDVPIPDVRYQCVILTRMGEEKVRGYVKKNPFPYRGREEWVIEPYHILNELTPEEIGDITRRFYYNAQTGLEVVLLKEEELKTWVRTKIRQIKSGDTPGSTR